MRKFIAFIVFIIAVSSFYYFQFKNPLNQQQGEQLFYYEDSCDRLNDDFWFVGEWLTTFDGSQKVDVKNGLLTLPVDDVDRSPFLLSKGIPVKKGDIVTIKRRVKMHYGNEKFTGGLALVQTDAPELQLVTGSEGWSRSLGEAIAVVEYVHNYDETSERPGRHIFRVMSPLWETDNEYALLQPKFDEWFEEELIYDTRNLKVTYKLNNEVVKINTLLLDKPYVKVFMHSYGQFTGHYTKMDNFSIEVIKGYTK